MLLLKGLSVDTQLPLPVVLATVWRTVFRAREFDFIWEIELEFKWHLMKMKVEEKHGL